MTDSKVLQQWVAEVAERTKPERVVWCDGSSSEKARLISEMLSCGTLERLNEEHYPGCYLHRSDSSDVARTERETGGSAGLDGGAKFVHAIRADTQIRIAGALNDILGDQDWESPV